MTDLTTKRGQGWGRVRIAAAGPGELADRLEARAWVIRKDGCPNPAEALGQAFQIEAAAAYLRQMIERIGLLETALAQVAYQSGRIDCDDRLVGELLAGLGVAELDSVPNRYPAPPPDGPDGEAG